MRYQAAKPLRSLIFWVAAGLTFSCNGCTAPIKNVDFTLSPSQAGLTVAAGSAQSVQLSAVPANGFSQSIQVVVSGAPSGVTASPATFSLMPGSPQQVSFTAAASAPAATVTIQFTGTAGSLSSSASLTLTVTAAVNTSNVDVVTYHDDIGRTGLNPNEGILTPANVTSSTFGLLRVLAVDGLVDGQPLYLSNLSVAGQTQNVVFVVTEHDSVYAFNADTGAQLWKTSILGANETTSGDHGCGQITPEIGITSTPVIDRSAASHGAIFVVGMSLGRRRRLPPASSRPRCDHRCRALGQSH